MKKDLFSESERLSEISKYLRRTFELWGYKEIFLPSVEEYSPNLRRGLKIAYNNEFYLVKPDMTSQIAFNMKSPKAMKIYYISEVLNDIRGKWQAGLEFIGGSEEYMAVEILSVVITSLEALNIQDFYIDVGSLAVWRNALSGMEKFEKSIFEALAKRNFGIIESLPISEEKKEELWRLFNFRGKKSGVEKVDRIVEALGDDRVFIDFGTIRPLPYYDDVIFEVYSPKLGKPIGGGGGYKIGGLSAFGFAFNLKALAKLYTGKFEKSRKVLKGLDSYREARRLVKLGIPVEVRENEDSTS
ncbi:hypothetical protein PAP_03845 [Palaeococcus pacificus DY20341]|uniref:Histidine--tRNA ligase n=1 Tax=Palaeococcus pacificus DY20341 TaxID=1343739 RepID=A0A075LSW1_9EURY|nr:ATP phosphoribosyltransferase regulatory subunit [Palaeococcus pacificus]AIF69186.1 hypothetical protein PAP_03845 [Palaeococcus pacificus DY20341]